MEVQTESLKEILGELFTLLEAQETHSVAILQFLKDQGIATDEKLAPYLEQAGRASNLKWLAAGIRMEHLLTPIQKETTDGNKDKEKAQQSGQKKSRQKDKDGDKEKPEPAQALAQGPVQQRSASENQNDAKRTEKNENADNRAVNNEKADAEKPAQSKTAKN
jgi:hypothetical protein